MAKLDSMKLLAFLGFSLASLVLVPAVASADEGEARPIVTQNANATIDVIHLRSNGIVVGRVTEIAAGEYVSIVTPTGETRHVPWSDVERVIVANTSFPPRRVPRPPPSPPPAAPPPAEPAPMVGPLVRVHIDTSGPAYLYRQAAGTTDYVTACEAPCDIELPLGDSYKIGGNGLTTTKAFRLDGKPGQTVTLSVSGANWFGIVSGGGLMVVGGFVSYIGLILAAVADKHNDSGAAGLGCILGGGAALGLGILVFTRSTTTDISQASPGASKDAFVRTPIWRSAANEQGRAAPATFPVLFERRF